jgi:ubiquitin related modifier 1
MSEETLPINVEFRYDLRSLNTAVSDVYSGGLELLFDNQKKYSLSIPSKDQSGAPSNVAFLVRYLCDKVMKDPRKDMFVLDDTV